MIWGLFLFAVKYTIEYICCKINQTTTTKTTKYRNFTNGNQKLFWNGGSETLISYIWNSGLFAFFLNIFQLFNCEMNIILRYFPEYFCQDPWDPIGIVKLILLFCFGSLFSIIIRVAVSFNQHTTARYVWFIWSSNWCKNFGEWRSPMHVGAEHVWTLRGG